MKDPVRYSEYQRTSIANESPSPSAIWLGVIDGLCALYEQFCKMAVVWTQIVVIGGECLRTLHHITVAAVLTFVKNASDLVSIRPLGSPLRPWVTTVDVPSLRGPSILD